ncbi:putative beta-galactosidase [Gongronella butleri]|nr:putative beta-galactosidase [Gongronella butleri]
MVSTGFLKGALLTLTAAAQLVSAVSSTGLTDLVEWDQYSLFVNGTRQFVYSGEFHYYRLPSPDLWRDVFEKYKALGVNTASIYFYWGYHSPAPGVYDFTGIRDIELCLQMAKEAGVSVISRAGPYINAEVDEGGFPGWLMKSSMTTRKNNTAYNEAWSEWLTAVDKYLEAAQITHGGPIILNQIENEYDFNTDADHMAALEEKFRADGLQVPFTFNDAWTNSKFAKGTGAVDIYGWDSYPQGFDCSNPSVWPYNTSRSWRSYHEGLNPTEPMALYEFQGGAFDPWGGAGYDKCRELVNVPFAKVYYKNNFAQGATIQSLYMLYGGTSWGAIATTSVYTSYDYGSAISEPRVLTGKAYEVKLQATFLHTVKPFLTTTGFAGSADNANILVDGLQSVNSTTKFYIAQHYNTPSTKLDKFHVSANTTAGTFNIPRLNGTSVTLNGRDAKILTTDYAFNSHYLLYSTSEIFVHESFGNLDVMLVYAYSGEDGETTFKFDSNGASAKVMNGDKTVTSKTVNGNQLQINYGHANGTTPILISNKNSSSQLLLLVADYDTATRWWAPEIASGQRVLVSGPYLVRSAEITGSILYLKGDTDQTTSLEVIAPPNVKTIYWNGGKITTRKTSYGSFAGHIAGPKPVKLPNFADLKWKYSYGSPETDASFDDSTWTVADHNSTNANTAPITTPVLYADDYDYHYGSVWFRGSFEGSSGVTGLNVTAIGGSGYAWAAWLNGNYLGGFTENYELLDVSSSDLNSTNVISLLVWSTGHQEDWNNNEEYRRPLGFRQVELVGSDADITWKVQGAVGGESPVDTVRGSYNGGGLYGERFGWHLPGFPDTNWTEAAIPDPVERPGVSWYRTEFDLDIPAGYDVPIGVRFTDDSSKKYRALLFVNGWQFGRYANDLGPQTLFYIPQGILNHNGQNTIAIAVVSLDAKTSIGKVTLEAYSTLLSSMPTVSNVEAPAYKDLFKA